MTAFVANWLISETMALPELESEQQTPGTKRLWKQIDFLKLSSWRRRAGQLPRSRHVPLPPSGVVHGRFAFEELDEASEEPGNGMSTLLPELIFSALGGVVVVDVDDACPLLLLFVSKCVSVSLPMLKSALPSPRPSRSLWLCWSSLVVTGQEIHSFIHPSLARK